MQRESGCLSFALPCNLCLHTFELLLAELIDSGSNSFDSEGDCPISLYGTLDEGRLDGGL